MIWAFQTGGAMTYEVVYNSDVVLGNNANLATYCISMTGPAETEANYYR